MFYWIALLVASCLAGCRSHSGETDMQTRMRTEIVTNVRDSVLPFWMDYAVAPDGGFYGTVLRSATTCSTGAITGCSERRGSECPDSVEFFCRIPYV